MNRIIKKDMLADLTSTYTMLQEIKRPTPRGNWPGQLAGRTEEEKKKKKKIPKTSHQQKGATGHYIPHPSRGREGRTPPPTTHPPPPAARPCRFHRWGEEMPTNRAKDRADAQRLVATRLLDRLHDPLGHFGRLQRIYPRAW